MDTINNLTTLRSISPAGESCLEMIFKQMILTLFVEHCQRQPNPKSYYNDFLQSVETELVTKLNGGITEVEDMTKQNVLLDLIFSGGRKEKIIEEHLKMYKELIAEFAKLDIDGTHKH